MKNPSSNLTFRLIPKHTSPSLTRVPYVCKSCTRKYSSPTTITNRQVPTTIPSNGFAYLSSRRLISLRGPDSTKYLQGVITSNIEEKRSAGFYSAFLNAKGRVLNDVFIYPDGGMGNWLLEVDAKEVGVLAKHIQRYRMRAKFEIRVLDVGERGVWSIWGDQSTAKDGNDGIGCMDSRAPGMGRRLILEGERKPEVDLEESGEGAYRVRRYMIGVPEGQDEILKEVALPQESNIDVMGGISYDKGCYVGQELTIRTHHMGLVRKRIVPMMVLEKGEEYSGEVEWRGGNLAESVLEGGNIKKVAEGGGGKGRPAGKWLAGVGNLGLGLARLEVMGRSTDGKWVANGEEFMVEGKNEDGDGIRVRAFPPAWLES